MQSSPHWLGARAVLHGVCKTAQPLQPPHLQAISRLLLSVLKSCNVKLQITRHTSPAPPLHPHHGQTKKDSTQRVRIQGRPQSQDIQSGGEWGELQKTSNPRQPHRPAKVTGTTSPYPQVACWTALGPPLPIPRPGQLTQLKELLPPSNVEVR